MNKNFLVIISIAIFPLIVIFLFSFYFYYLAAVKTGNNYNSYYTLVINQGDNLSVITKLLDKDKVIKSDIIFTLYLKLNKLDVKVQAGEYDIPPHVNVEELAEILQSGVFDRKLTFLEGERVEQYALRAAETIATDEAEKQIFINDFLEIAKSKEGYLFPDTYSYNTETTPQGLIDWMTARFAEIITPVLNTNKLNLTSEEVIILASIVEREGRSSTDRPVIAGILINRLNEDTPLYVDATTQYQIDSERLNSLPIETVNFWKTEITQDYLESESLFNTRKIIGLPPTPICNPSLQSVEAVINYQKTGYYYYIHDNDGVVHYAKTLDEHNENVSKYLGYK